MQGNHKMILAHAIKTIEYRFIKVTARSIVDFGEFRISHDTRTPNEIINHMFDLAAKTNCMIKEGHFNSSPAPVSDFINEKARFLNELENLQETISCLEIDWTSARKLLQGPILDLVTHIGQIAMLNGLFGNKIPKESYYDSKIE